MKAITLHQPWASLICDRHKSSETRSWAPTRSLIGQTIAIHAGKNRECIDWFPDFYGDGKSLPLGAIVCTARLAGVFQVSVIENSKIEGKACDQHDHYHDIAYSENRSASVVIDDMGDYSLGRWIWCVDEVKPVNRIVPIRGYQGLWDVDVDFVMGLF